MANIGVTIAIIKANQILLIKREDFQIWALPGGAVEAGESLAEAAVRETFEETGLEVELVSLVGIYSRPTWMGAGNHIAVFQADIVGGGLSPQPEEVVDLGFFTPQNLPTPMFWWHDQPIKDAMAGVGGSVVYKQTITVPSMPEVLTLSRQELYDRRDRGELPIKSILADLCQPANSDDQILEVGPS